MGHWTMEMLTMNGERDARLTTLRITVCGAMPGHAMSYTKNVPHKV